MRFRKKPVVIEAYRWYKPGDLGIFQGPQPDPRCGWCETLEGGHVVSPGDWIITGVKCERYPCKPDICALTYENAEAFESPQPAQADEAREIIERFVALVPDPPLVSCGYDSPPEHATQDDHELGYTLHLARAYRARTGGKEET